MKKALLAFLMVIPLLYGFLYFFGNPNNRLIHAWPWFLTRAAGLTSLLLVFLLIFMGIGMVVGYTYRVFSPLEAWIFHRAMGIALLVTVLIHVISLLFDKYQAFTVLEVFIPFVSSFRKVTFLGMSLGSIWIALGIFGLYCVALIVYTSVFVFDKKHTLWRLAHYISYGLAPAVLLHSISIGTDFLNRFVSVAGYLITAILICVASLRLLRQNAHHARLKGETL